MPRLALGFGYTMAWEDPILGGAVTEDSNGARVKYGVNEKEWPGVWAGGEPSLQEVIELYARDHWGKLAAVQLGSQELAQRVVDCAWNDGARTAGRLLQDAVNRLIQSSQAERTLTPLVVDGVVGPVTVAAVADLPDPFVLLLFQEQWLAHIDRMIAADPGKEKDRGGWERRARGLVDA